MRFLYFICALVALGSMAGRAQQPAADDAHAFVVFLRGTPVGREEMTVGSEGGSMVITAKGRLSAPIDLLTRRAEVRYAADGTPQSLEIEATFRGGETTLRTTFSDGQARSEGTQGGQAVTKVDKVSSRTVVLPNFFFGAHEALARRLATVEQGAELRAYIAPQIEIPVRVKAVVSEKIQVASDVFAVRRYDLGFDQPGGELTVQLTADEQGHLIRLTVPAQSLDVVREDVAASTSRTHTYSNPGDEPITMPGSGFNIAGTLTRPKDDRQARNGRFPAVVLHTGSGVGDRDGLAAGVPTLGQLAGALAEAGFLAVRYDKRGYGQTGGRAESATMSDFAEDLRSVVKYLERRRDVDRRRVAVVGHSEGAWVALLAASRENDIDAVVSIAAPAGTGAEVVLDQQRRALEAMKVPDAERQAKIDLQKRILSAVVTGKGWDDIPPDVRKQADTPWFQSLLTFDPAKVIDNVDQPILILHGELDRQVPVSHAEQLAKMAEKGDSRAVELVTVIGVNHLLVPALTGEVSEYGSLPDRNVSPHVTKAIADWLTKTFRASP